MKTMSIEDYQWILAKNKMTGWKELMEELNTLDSTKVIVVDVAEVMKHRFRNVTIFRERVRQHGKANGKKLITRCAEDKVYIAQE